MPSIRRAAEAVGISRVTVHRLQKKDEQFALALHDAREDALDTLEEVMLMRARTGQPITKTVTRTFPDGSKEETVTKDSHLSDTLGMFYLKRWRPEYRDSYRTEVTGPGGGPLQIESVAGIDARIAELAAELQQRAVHGRGEDDEPDADD